MTAANEALRDLNIRHAIHLLRYGNDLQNRAIKAFLGKIETDVLERLAGRLALIEERGIDMGPATTARLQDTLDEVRTLIDGAYAVAHGALAAELLELAANEVVFQGKALEKSITVNLPVRSPAPGLLSAIVNERPIQGVLLKSFVKGMAAGTANRIEEAVRIGMAEGQGVDAIVRRIKGTKAANYKNGILEISRRSARSIVRTSINHVANHSAQATWAANDHIVKGWAFLATLDLRTTTICASLDGKVFELGKGPVPPRHISCRSITTAVTKSFAELGLDRADYTPERRASMDGQIAKPTNFGGWLKDQSAERQVAVLGKTRAALWRDGKLDLGDFIRDQRTVIPLSELKRLHPDAFN